MESRKNLSVSVIILSSTALLFSLFHFYTAFFGTFTAIIQRGIHVTLAILIIFLINPFSKKKKNLWTKTINIVFILLAILSEIYLLFNGSPEKMVERAVTGPSPLDLLMGGIVILLIFEATRRVCMPLAWVVLIFLLYGYFGNFLPGIIGHKGFDLNSIIDYMIFSTEGIYGLPLGVSATIIALFVIFGAFLETSGGGKFFVDLSFAMTGRYKSGPALAAVSASSLMGSISGSAVANVSTTGTFTIPLMKKVGYKPHFAGAVEATASTGGQLMPPIMGAGAFIMAEVLGVPYFDVALAAIIPAILFYMGIGWMVYLESERIGLKQLSEEERPKFKRTLKEGYYFLIPVMVLIIMLIVFGTTPTKAALLGIISVIIVSFFRESSRMTPSKILSALINGAKSAVDVAIACAAAGIIIGVFTMTGLGLKLSNLVITLSQGNLLLALILTMIACIILGMGVPTAAAYIITAALVAPALIELGVVPIAAHIFIFYFAIISAITPPVALAAFTGAGIANANSMKTAFTASRLGIVAYVVPFSLVYGPSLVLEGTPSQIILTTITALIGVALLGMGVQGWFLIRLNYIVRALLVFLSLSLIKPGILTDIFGLVGGLVILFLIYKKKKGMHVISDVVSEKSV